jgi:hypothetical protein
MNRGFSARADNPRWRCGYSAPAIADYLQTTARAIGPSRIRGGCVCGGAEHVRRRGFLFRSKRRALGSLRRTYGPDTMPDRIRRRVSRRSSRAPRSQRARPPAARVASGRSLPRPDLGEQ